jgi:hypothetical protein
MHVSEHYRGRLHVACHDERWGGARRNVGTENVCVASPHAAERRLLAHARSGRTKTPPTSIQSLAYTCAPPRSPLADPKDAPVTRQSKSDGGDSGAGMAPQPAGGRVKAGGWLGKAGPQPPTQRLKKRGGGEKRQKCGSLHSPARLGAGPCPRPLPMVGAPHHPPPV